LILDSKQQPANLIFKTIGKGNDEHANERLTNTASTEQQQRVAEAGQGDRIHFVRKLLEFQQQAASLRRSSMSMLSVARLSAPRQERAQYCRDPDGSLSRAFHSERVWQGRSMQTFCIVCCSEIPPARARRRARTCSRACQIEYRRGYIEDRNRRVCKSCGRPLRRKSKGTVFPSNESAV
jgi:hypothetical protein